MNKFLLILSTTIGIGTILGGLTLFGFLLKHNEVAQQEAIENAPPEQPKTLTIEVPAEGVVILCHGPNMVKVAAAYDYEPIPLI